MSSSSKGIFSDLNTKTARRLLKRLPKAELHVHLEGTMSPELVKHMSEKYSASLPPELFTEDGKNFRWNNFLEFLVCYDQASSVINCTEAMTEITYEYLKTSHSHGSIYTELTVSPDHLARYGISYNESVQAVVAGIQRANLEFGIESRIIVVLVRHLGAEACEKLVEAVIRNRHDYVCGIGLAGDEEGFEPSLFVNAFRMAKEAGLKLTAHAGEITHSGDVLNAIEMLGVQRIGHGIHAAFDPEALQLIKDQGIHLELCPTSNQKLQTRNHYPNKHKDLEHPLTILHEAGISYSLGTDDPPFFDTNLHQEYAYTARLLKLEARELLAITMRAIEHSFAPEDLKLKLMKKVTEFSVENNLESRFEQDRSAGMALA